MSPPLRKRRADETWREWFDSLSDVDKEQATDEQQRRVRESTPRSSGPPDHEARARANVERDKRRLFDAYQQATGLPMPTEFVTALEAITTGEEFTRFMAKIEPFSTDTSKTPIWNAFIGLDTGTLVPRDEDADFAIRIDDDLTDIESGDVIEEPSLADNETAAIGESGSRTPPPPPGIDRSYIGFPGEVPGGFEAGLGVDPSEQERADALARIERTRRARDGDYLSGGRFRTNDPDLINRSVFSDGGTLEFRYWEGEEYTFSWKGVNWIRSTQARFERAGLLPPGSYVPGLWDGTTSTAMRNLMGDSNAKGVTWDMVIDERISLISPELLAELYGTNGGARGRIPFTSPTYRAPDHVSLSQAVKQLVRDRLRREPSAREMADLTSQMDGDYRKAYNVEVSALRQEYDATTRAIDTEESQGAGSVRLVDPSARFQQAFEQKFKGELSLAEDTDDTIIQTAKIQGAMSRLDSMIGF